MLEDSYTGIKVAIGLWLIVLILTLFILYDSHRNDKQRVEEVFGYMQTHYDLSESELLMNKRDLTRGVEYELMYDDLNVIFLYDGLKLVSVKEKK